MKKYENLSFISAGYGQKTITITYYGKKISAHYTCMPIFDLWHSGERGWKTAGNQMYDFVVSQKKSV